MLNLERCFQPEAAAEEKNNLRTTAGGTDLTSMSSLLETDRLKLRKFSQSDLDELFSMVADEDQMRFYPRPKTRDEASAWISRNLALYKECGFGFWLIASIQSSDFLGYCGIRPLELDGRREIEIGWHTKKTCWNQGIATEAAMAVRDLAFTRFRLPRLIAIIHPDHIGSRRVAEKIGMHSERTTILQEYDDYPAVVYAVTPGRQRMDEELGSSETTVGAKSAQGVHGD